MKLNACNDSILHSRASVLILGLSSDGTVLAPIAQRLLGLYPCFISHYKDKAHKGELALGDVLVHTVQKQIAGLGVSSNIGASHIIGVIHQHQPTQAVHLSAWQMALPTIDQALYKLMRYQHIKQVALLAPKDRECTHLAEPFWQLLQKLSTPRIHLEVHFDKAVDCTNFV